MTNVVNTFSLPVEAGDVSGIAAAPDGSVWVVGSNWGNTGISVYHYSGNGTFIKRLFLSPGDPPGGAPVHLAVATPAMQGDAKADYNIWAVDEVGRLYSWSASASDGGTIRYFDRFSSTLPRQIAWDPWLECLWIVDTNKGSICAISDAPRAPTILQDFWYNGPGLAAELALPPSRLIHAQQLELARTVEKKVLTPDKNSAVADGSDMVKLVLQVLDARNQPIQGLYIRWETGGKMVGHPVSITDPHGKAEIGLISTKPGDIQVSAKVKVSNVTLSSQTIAFNEAPIRLTGVTQSLDIQGSGFKADDKVAVGIADKWGPATRTHYESATVIGADLSGRAIHDEDRVFFRVYRGTYTVTEGTAGSDMLKKITDAKGGTYSNEVSLEWHAFELTGLSPEFLDHGPGAFEHPVILSGGGFGNETKVALGYRGKWWPQKITTHTRHSITVQASFGADIRDDSFAPGSDDREHDDEIVSFLVYEDDKGSYTVGNGTDDTTLRQAIKDRKIISAGEKTLTFRRFTLNGFYYIVPGNDRKKCIHPSYGEQIKNNFPLTVYPDLNAKWARWGLIKVKGSDSYLIWDGGEVWDHYYFYCYGPADAETIHPKLSISCNYNVMTGMLPVNRNEWKRFLFHFEPDSAEDNLFSIYVEDVDWEGDDTGKRWLLAVVEAPDQSPTVAYVREDWTTIRDYGFTEAKFWLNHDSVPSVTVTCKKWKLVPVN